MNGTVNALDPPFWDGDPWSDLDEEGNAPGLSPLEILRPDELLLQYPNDINVSAPMVRYSKLPARMLFGSYNTHIVYTPMMVAREFVRSAKARDLEFTTNRHERGIFNFPSRTSKHSRRIRGALIAQFAARSGTEFADAVEMMHPHVEGIDLNCGCPQPWAYKDEIGSYLLRQPHLVQDMIKQARARINSDTYPISIKIRIDTDDKHTSQLVQTAIRAGVSYIGVHGRTRHQRDTDPVNLPGIAFAVSETRGAIPVVANGDCFKYSDAVHARAETGAHAVMSARGMLENPALFAGYERTPFECIDRWLDISTALGFNFGLFHRHTAWMLEKHFGGKAEKAYFNSLTDYFQVLDWIQLFQDKRRKADRSFTRLPDQAIVEGFNQAKAKKPEDLQSIVDKLQGGLKLRSGVDTSTAVVA